MSSPNDHAPNRLLLKKTLCYVLSTIKHTAVGRLKSTNTQHVLCDVYRVKNMGIMTKQ